MATPGTCNPNNAKLLRRRVEGDDASLLCQASKSSFACQPLAFSFDRPTSATKTNMFANRKRVQGAGNNDIAMRYVAPCQFPVQLALQILIIEGVWGKQREQMLLLQRAMSSLQ